MGIVEQLKKAGSVAQVQSLLAQAATFKHASVNTMAKWEKIAKRKLAAFNAKKAGKE